VSTRTSFPVRLRDECLRHRARRWPGLRPLPLDPGTAPGAERRNWPAEFPARRGDHLGHDLRRLPPTQRRRWWLRDSTLRQPVRVTALVATRPRSQRGSTCSTATGLGLGYPDRLWSAPRTSSSPRPRSKSQPLRTQQPGHGTTLDFGDSYNMMLHVSTVLPPPTERWTDGPATTTPVLALPHNTNGPSLLRRREVSASLTNYSATPRRHHHAFPQPTTSAATANAQMRPTGIG